MKFQKVDEYGVLIGEHGVLMGEQEHGVPLGIMVRITAFLTF